MTADAHRAHRHHADDHRRDDAAGGPVPGAVQRRPAQLDQHQRPARQGAAHQGQGRRQLHRSRPATCSLRARRATRPEIYAMGFRNPFRIQVDENDVAYVTDYSPDSHAADAAAGGLRHRAHGDRPPPGQLRLAHVLQDRPPDVQVELQHADDIGRDVRLRRRHARADEPVALEHRAGSHPADHQPGHVVLVPRRPVGHAVLRQLQHGPGPHRARGSGPSSVTGGVGPHGATKYHYDPNNPSTTKFPPYYDNAVFFGEFTRNYLKRSAWTRATRS